VTSTTPVPPKLADRARAAIADAELQRALRNVTAILGRGSRMTRTDPELVELRARAAGLRREVLSDLDGWLDRLQGKLESLGVTVHRAAGVEEARAAVLGIAQAEGVRLVVKSKSMATEEVHLNEALEAHGIEVVETDLGEYVIQLARERPSHIIAPAIHKSVAQVARLFTAEAGRPLAEDRTALCAFARERLRDLFLRADMGVTGANFVTVDTGTIVLVTNEGNGRMCTTLPRVHVCLMPVDKVFPRLADLGALLPLLTRSATGQSLSTYVSMITGPRRHGEVDGPERLHVVFLDHNRRSLVGTPYEEMRACLNVCPVYTKIGGHAYGSVYSGPMGAVLTPLLSAGTEGRDLPDATSLCGACTEACPVGIPLADLLVRLRADLRRPGPAVPLVPPWPSGPPAPPRPGGSPAPSEIEAMGAPRVRRPGPRTMARRGAFAAWARLWARPAGYRLSTAVMRRLARRAPFGRLPGLAGWTEGRDLPTPPPRSFRHRWAHRSEERW
jgi:L-lactate dehydrogenase complex protein LldF